jgi:hypothetical protein
MNEPEQRTVVARRGELVCWKSNRLGWFKGSCEPMILVSLVDAGSGHAFARFVPNNSAQEHFRILRCYIERWGRPQEIRTGNASPFLSLGRDDKSAGAQGNQIQRALHELEIRRSLEDRSEPDKWLLRFLQDAKQRLVPCLRQSHGSTTEEANRYLEQIYLPQWNAANSVSHATNSHAAPLHRRQLNSILSIVTLREIDSQNMVRYRSRDYEVSSGDLTPKGRIVRIENHLDDTVHFQLQGQKIKVHFVEKNKILRTQESQQKPKQGRRRRTYNRNWMKEFSNWEAPPLWTQLRSE